MTPTLIDYVQDRNGKVIFRTDNRCQVMEGQWRRLQRGRLGRQGDAAAAVAAPSSCSMPQAAYQMVHILEGVVERGTATVLRDLDRPLFGKTGTTIRPDQRLVRRRHARRRRRRLSSATTSRGRWAHAAQGGRIAAPIFKQFAQVAFKDMPKIPFVAPPGIRMVRIDRATGKRVFGTFPTTEDPKSSVIWEAFQPETEPRRSFRRELRAGQGAAATATSRTPAAHGRARRPGPAARPPTAPNSCKGRAASTSAPQAVTPAQAGIQSCMDPSLR